MGVQEVEFYLNGKKFRHQFCVCTLPTKADGIVGMDFLSERKAVLNLADQEFRLEKNSNSVQRKQQTGGGAEHPALTVFVTQNDRHSREERSQKFTRNREDTQEKENN